MQIKNSIDTLRHKILAWTLPSWTWVAAIILIWLIFNLATLVQYPVASVDEGWNANRSLGLLQTGQAFGTMDAGVYENFAGYWTYYPWLGAWFHSVAIALFGPTLFAVRLVSLAFGFALAIAIYIIGRLLYTHLIGLLAVVLLSLSESFLYSSHLARHDIIVAASGYGAVALCLISNRTSSARNSVLLSIAAGLMLGLSIDIHLNGIVFIPVILAVYVLRQGRQLLSRLNFWGFTLGLTLGVTVFVLLHLFQYPETYIAISQLGNPTSRTPPILELNPRSWLVALVGTSALFLDDWRSPLAIVSAILLLQVRPFSAKKLPILFAVLFLSFAGTIRYQSPHYAILITPMGDMLVAVFLHKLYHGRTQITTRAGYVRNAVIWGLIGASILSNVTPLRGDTYGEYELILREIRKAIPAGSSVLGSTIYWFARPSDPYYTQYQLVYYQRYYPERTLTDAIRSYAPDYILISENKETEGFFSPIQWVWTLHYIGPSIPNDELEQVAIEHGHPMGKMNTRWFGYLHLYKMDWKDPKD